MNPEAWVRSCLKKKRIRTRGYADSVAAKMGLRVYFCGQCFGYHLSSRYDYKNPNGAAEMIIRILFPVHE